MKMRSSTELRQLFIDFFKKKGHTFVPSSRVIPDNDPTLLFINAGMNQFKDIFLGRGKRDYTRAVNSQKCMRVAGKHNDLEEVGRDGTHHTYFEMLGNWSFGDYYKKEAITWCWEFLTEEVGLPKERLWASVFTDDDEAFDLWKSETNIDPARILRFGHKDNFWEMGDVGPCGPCSEVHFDLGEELNVGDPAKDCVNGDSPRFMEIWNLVFIQSLRNTDGSLSPLDACHVDTGMGFERICSVVQGKTSNYETDIFQPLIQKVSALSGVKYDPNGEAGTPHRVIADHIRALCFTLADGAMPSNEGQGYVLRRLLRRAVRFGKNLGFNQPFFHKLVGITVKLYGDFFTELKEKEAHIEAVIKSEEERFYKTLDLGLKLLDDAIIRIDSKSKVLPGETAFKLYDTFGFPLDLTALICEERGFKVDQDGFDQYMQEQKNRGREASTFKMDLDGDAALPTDLPETEFTGYESLTNEGKLLKKLSAATGDILIFDKTPFYAEKGGQAGDSGCVNNQIKIRDVQVKNNIYLHICDAESSTDELVEGQTYSLVVDKTRRRAIEKNHTATHLLHQVLKEVLGSHVEQAGSLVEEERFRFDFSHPKGLSEKERSRIENLVNERIQAGVESLTEIKDIETAKKEGAVAIFGEKYGSEVRVVRVGDFSTELCGGTHVSRSSDIGLFKITSEGSIAANIRRIEGITGLSALHFLTGFREMINKISLLTKSPADKLYTRVENLMKENKSRAKEIAQLKKEIFKSQIPYMVEKASEIPEKRIKVIAEFVPDVEGGELRSLAPMILEKLPGGIVILATGDNEKGQLACAVAKETTKKGFQAGKIVKSLAEKAGGRGGGRPELAMAGFQNIEEMKKLLAEGAKLLGSI